MLVQNITNDETKKKCMIAKVINNVLYISNYFTELFWRRYSSRRNIFITNLSRTRVSHTHTHPLRLPHSKHLFATAFEWCLEKKFHLITTWVPQPLLLLPIGHPIYRMCHMKELNGLQGSTLLGLYLLILRYHQILEYKVKSEEIVVFNTFEFWDIW